jgi:hypothetical protein
MHVASRTRAASKRPRQGGETRREEQTAPRSQRFRQERAPWQKSERREGAWQASAAGGRPDGVAGERGGRASRWRGRRARREGVPMAWQANEAPASGRGHATARWCRGRAWDCTGVGARLRWRAGLRLRGAARGASAWRARGASVRERGRANVGARPRQRGRGAASARGGCVSAKAASVRGQGRGRARVGHASVRGLRQRRGEGLPVLLRGRTECRRYEGRGSARASCPRRRSRSRWGCA